MTVIRSRDRDATAQSIVDAARKLLIAEGFNGIGINAIARAAGCDKQLVYRYFGGVDGVVDAIGGDLAHWVSDHLAPMAALGQPDSYADLVERLMLGFLHALRGDPLMQKIMIWELAGGGPALQRLNEARSKAMMVWVQEIRGELRAPEGVDAGAINAVLIAAIQHMVLAASTAGQFSGLDLSQEAGWERMRQVIRRMVRALL